MSRAALAVEREISRLIGVLVENGFADDQVLPFTRQVGETRWEVTHENALAVGASGGRMSYREMHSALLREREFNVKMPDGALLDLYYKFDGEEVAQHRLAFLPHPDLDDYQNEPELYDEELIYAEVCELGAVATPIRFDFDRENFVEVEHPMSHATLGQYKNCRIAVSRAISPFLFFHFVMNAFYKTAAASIADDLGGVGVQFTDTTITRRERERVHIAC